MSRKESYPSRRYVEIQVPLQRVGRMLAAQGSRGSKPGGLECGVGTLESDFLGNKGGPYSEGAALKHSLERSVI